MIANTIARSVQFSGDPLALFDRLTGDNTDVILFESPGEVSRRAEKSLLFTSSALRIESRFEQVEITALSRGGHKSLESIAARLSPLFSVALTEGLIRVTVPEQNRALSDRERIKATSSADVLRILSTQWSRGTQDTPPIYTPGIFAYDFLEQFEKLPAAAADPLDFPDFVFWLPETVIILNNREKSALVCVHTYGEKDTPDRAVEKLDQITKTVLPTVMATAEESGTVPDQAGEPDLSIESDLDDGDYGAMVKKLKSHIVAGDVFQIVLSRTFKTQCFNPLSAYRELRRLNPSPYLFFARGKDFTLFGASPEACVRVGGWPRKVEIHPIAGTRGRGRTETGGIDVDLDNRLEAALKLDAKELAEHMMLVDLARNDVARIAKPGTRLVKRLLSVERYSHVMHLVSIIEGALMDDLDALHAYMASMNMGTLVGAPKIEAARLLRLYEKEKRGPYGGAVGFLTSTGILESAIIIRSALVKNDTAHVRAGAGVVYDSDPAGEAMETRNKANAVLRAIHLARTDQK